MKEIYLAMDATGAVFSFKEMPTLFDGVWKGVKAEYVIDMFKEFGISKDKLTHEQPIKIRAVWEQIND